jgi:DNA (cytosine-5)-methyltransferase 1
MPLPTHLDLFSGIGGWALAAKWAGFRTVGFVEIDSYCQKVLAKNFMAESASVRCKHETGNRNGEPQTQSGTPAVSERCPRIYGNIFDFDGTAYRGVDLITGSPPCQPFSVAGKQRGAADERHLWPEMLRVVTQARPTWIALEQVPGVIPMELDNMLSSLEGIGYATRPFIIPACSVDARHRRYRVWVIAGDVSDAQRDGPSGCEKRRSFIEAAGEQSAWTQHALYSAGTDSFASAGPIVGQPEQPRLERHGGHGTGSGQPGREPKESNRPAGAAGLRRDVSDPEKRTERTRLREDEQAGERWGRSGDSSCSFATWLPEPTMGQLVDGVSGGLVRFAGRVATAVPNRVQKLKALGNAIVPQVAYEILREIRREI